MRGCSTCLKYAICRQKKQVGGSYKVYCSSSCSLASLTALLKLNMVIICSAKLSYQRRRNQLLNMLQKKRRRGIRRALCYEKYEWPVKSVAKTRPNYGMVERLRSRLNTKQSWYAIVPFHSVPFRSVPFRSVPV